MLRIIHLFKLIDIMELLGMSNDCLCVVDITTMWLIRGYPSTLRKEMRMAYLLAALLHVRTYGP